MRPGLGMEFRVAIKTGHPGTVFLLIMDHYPAMSPMMTEEPFLMGRLNLISIKASIITNTIVRTVKQTETEAGHT